MIRPRVRLDDETRSQAKINSHHNSMYASKLDSGLEWHKEFANYLTKSITHVWCSVDSALWTAVTSEMLKSIRLVINGK